MKNLRYIVSSALGLGALAFAPAAANADRVRGGDRDDQRGAARVEVRQRADERRGNDRDRVDRDDRARFDGDRDRVIISRPPVIVQPVYVEPCAAPNVDVNVQLCDVPGVVRDTAQREDLGAITSTQFVRRDGHEFYRFIVAARGGNWDLRVNLNGSLLGIDRC